jgi:thiol-disulfide isomerase/thioredoxin
VLLGAVFFVYTDTVPKKPRIDAVSYAEWTAELAARRGSVVVIPVWASWCQTCIEMLPSMAELSERYGQKGVLFASLCLDDHARKEDIEAAGRIVAANDARFPHFLPRQDIAASLEALTLKELPAVLVYDRTGELRYKLEGDRWSNAISPADVEDAIESLL